QRLNGPAPGAGGAQAAGRGDDLSVACRGPASGEVSHRRQPATVEVSTDDFVASWLGAVPGPVQCDEHVAAVRGRELAATVEAQSQWGGMCLDSGVGQGEVGAAGLAELAIGTAVIVAAWPAVVGALADGGKEVPGYLVAEAVSPVHRGPQLVCAGLDCQANGISKALRHQRVPAAVGVVAADGRVAGIGDVAHVAG